MLPHKKYFSEISSFHCSKIENTPGRQITLLKWPLGIDARLMLHWCSDLGENLCVGMS